MSMIEVSPAVMTALIGKQEGSLGALKSILGQFEQLSGPFHASLQGATGTKLQSALQTLVDTSHKSVATGHQILDMDRGTLASLIGQDETNSQAFNVA